MQLDYTMYLIKLLLYIRITVVSSLKSKNVIND